MFCNVQISSYPGHGLKNPLDEKIKEIQLKRFMINALGFQHKPSKFVKILSGSVFPFRNKYDT